MRQKEISDQLKKALLESIARDLTGMDEKALIQLMFLELGILWWYIRVGLPVTFINWEDDDVAFELESVKIDMRYDDE